jgi:hypothetical protein
VEKIEVRGYNYTVVCKFRSVSDQFEWTFVSFYGPNSDAEH